MGREGGREEGGRREGGGREEGGRRREGEGGGRAREGGTDLAIIIIIHTNKGVVCMQGVWEKRELIT